MLIKYRGVMLIKLYRGGSDVNQVVQRWELIKFTEVGVMLIKFTEVGVMLIKLYRGVNQVVQRWE